MGKILLFPGGVLLRHGAWEKSCGYMRCWRRAGSESGTLPGVVYIILCFCPYQPKHHRILQTKPVPMHRHFFLVYFLHGRHAFTIQSLYDTDDVIYSPGSVLNWLEIGRQGNVFTKKVFGLL